MGTCLLCGCDSQLRLLHLLCLLRRAELAGHLTLPTHWEGLLHPKSRRFLAGGGARE